uniref:PDZ domain-containing protein n=1 Tax=Cyprinus carpio carpio TaxID=630221 RepID=A0A9J8BM20_CYPCA
MANTLEREILERELRPRLCYVTKGDRGYGFHLHGDRNRGAQYIRRIEPGSPADLSGLRSGDRVVEVNGENVEGETHQQVVQRILEVEHRTRLLVVDRVTEEFLKFHGLPCTEDRAIEMGSLSSRSSAASSPRASPRDSATPPYSRQSSEGIFINKEETLSEVDVETKDLRPRLCHMTIGEQGYGFNLHCKKSRVGQYIRSVDPDSPAEHAGLRPRDRLIEVNDTSIEGLRHAEVVALIKAGGTETRLLVVDPETDELFNRLGIVPTSIHLKEDCVDGPVIESPKATCPTTRSTVPDAPKISPPIINITLTDPAISNGSPRHESHRSSSSRSTLSETSAEISSFDSSSKLTDSDHHSSDDARKPERDVKSEDPFRESGLQLSLTAAEAKQKAQAKRPNKRAPPMDWSKKQEIFSNF